MNDRQQELVEYYNELEYRYGQYRKFVVFQLAVAIMCVVTAFVTRYKAVCGVLFGINALLILLVLAVLHRIEKRIQRVVMEIMREGIRWKRNITH